MKSLPTGEELKLGNLPRFWQVVAEELAAVERLPPLATNRILSDRAFDESQPAGPRTYMAVDRYLGVAADNHEALLSVLEHHGATLWAPWSLLRPIFESSFMAAWILEPNDGQERRARGLRVEGVDAYEQRKRTAAFKAFDAIRQLIEDHEAETNAGAMATYKAEAAALGRRWDTVRAKVNVLDELSKMPFLRAQPDMIPSLEATWRLLSGYEHGFGWALLRGSDKQVIGKIDGGSEIRLVMNDETFELAAKSAYFLLMRACRVLRTRHLGRTSQHLPLT
jgi:hypothetical protein